MANAETNSVPSLQSIIFSRYVREKYLLYSVDEVQKLENLKEVKRVLKWYTPSSQPRNRIESIYITQVHNAAWERFLELKYPLHYVKSKDD